MKKRKLVEFASALAFAFAASSAHAELQFLQQEHLKGTGLGNVGTVLELHSLGNDPTPLVESGDVSPAGIDQLAGNDDSTNQTMLRTIGSLGISSASSMRLIFNPAEQGGGPISLDTLVFTIFNGSAPVFTASLPSAIAFGSTDPGVGNAGFSFRLTPTEAGAAQPFFVAGNTIGLQASLTGFDGGPEGFFISSVPEPGTWAIFAAGLIGVAGMARRRMSS